MQRDDSKDELLSLVEMQREYVKKIRDFQEECDKNQIIIEKLTKMGVKIWDYKLLFLLFYLLCAIYSIIHQTNMCPIVSVFTATTTR